MSDPPYVQHSHVALFADQEVNLSRDDAKEYRDQVNRLREKLEKHVQENPDVGLVKMLLSGSLAKGTALKTINDIDVAVYVRSGKAPSIKRDLLRWLAEKLREAYPQMTPDQISHGTHSVRISFHGTGLDVDVVPVYSEGDPDGRGYVIVFETGERVLTSIPLHLGFIRTRKGRQPKHFAQVIRLLKWWVRERKKADESFRFKSFMVEMVVAHLLDTGLDMSHHPSALEKVFQYIVKSGLRSRISFSDYYSPASLPGPTGKPIEIFDPVNAQNNVAKDYLEEDRRRIVEAAGESLERLAEARYATTKGRTLDCWQDVLGPSFQG